MTCIVGFVDKDNIYMGGDSAGSWGSELRPRKDPKVFIKDGMIYGFTSSFRMGQIIRSCFTRPEQPDGVSDYDYMCSIYIDKLSECFKEKGFIKIKDSEASVSTHTGPKFPKDPTTTAFFIYPP